jgi:hypothetical protein
MPQSITWLSSVTVQNCYLASDTDRGAQELSEWESLQEVRGGPFPKHVSQVEDGAEPRELRS